LVDVEPQALVLVGGVAPDGSALVEVLAPKRKAGSYRQIGRSTGVAFATENVPAKYAEWMKREVRFSNTPRPMAAISRAPPGVTLTPGRREFDAECPAVRQLRPPAGPAAPGRWSA
jgi:hypothetical protein